MLPLKSEHFISDWISDNFGLRIENDLQLSDLSFFDFNGQSLQDYAWVRGGTNLSISGTFAFESTSYLPLPGEFDIVVSGQNVTFDGDECILTSEEPNEQWECSSPIIQANLLNPNGATSETITIQLNNTIP